MIVITGTQRSGTSMWMQIMLAGGFSVVGKKFMANWEEAFKDANPDGFYETTFRMGMTETSPVFPAASVIKIFPVGLTRTPVNRINAAIATMRDVREFVRSKRRFWAIEDELVKQKGRKPRIRHNPALEWWSHNVALLFDSRNRNYPLRWVAYDSVLDNPLETVQKTFVWLNAGNVVMGANAVKPTNRTQVSDDVFDAGGVVDFPLELCVEWYKRVRHEATFTDDFLARLLVADQRLRRRYNPPRFEA